MSVILLSSLSVKYNGTSLYLISRRAEHSGTARKNTSARRVCITLIVDFKRVKSRVVSAVIADICSIRSVASLMNFGDCVFRVYLNIEIVLFTLRGVRHPVEYSCSLVVVQAAQRH